MAFREQRTHFPNKKWPLSGGAPRAQFISSLAARYAVRARARGRCGRPRASALRAHLLCHRGGAAVRDVFSLEEVPPSLISPLVTGTEPVDPSTYVTFFRPWTQALECTRRGHGLLRERHVVGPRVPAAQWRGPAIAARGGPLCGYSGPLRGLTSRAAYIAAPDRRRGHVVVSGLGAPLRGGAKPRRGAATRHRYQIPFQSLFF